MSKLLLSICIATYNRACYIGETLESIILQITDEVEIVIVDGASTDNTGSVVQRYIEVCKQIHYVRLPVKGGVDQDFCKAVEFARGEYCWLMPDDDVLKPRAISVVLDQIHHNYGLIIVNMEIRNVDLSRVIDDRRLLINTNRIYKLADSQQFMAEIGYHLAYIGCVVIKREIWNKREKEKYFNTEHIHVGIIFQSLIVEDVLVIVEPLISHRYGNALWTERSFEIWMFKWPNLIWSFTDYSDCTKRLVCPLEPWKKMRTLMNLRAMGLYSSKEYYFWLKPRFDSIFGRFVAKAITQCPSCVANFLGIVYLFFFRSRSNLPVWDLKNSQFYYLNCLNKLYRRFETMFKVSY
jgi:glycosyltransferase involved in cell wall biosynthesis